MMVTLCRGFAFFVNIATIACPASWKAVESFLPRISPFPLQTGVFVGLFVRKSALQPRWPHQKTIPCLVQMPHCDLLPTLAGSLQRRLIDHILDARASKAVGATGQLQRVTQLVVDNFA
jgi:hypothetical protein